MKRKNREMNIFSMSALDLFASALGAFILITIILLPYYLKVDREILEDLKKTQTLLAQCEKQKNSLSNQVSNLESNLNNCNNQREDLQANLNNCEVQNSSLSNQLQQSQFSEQQCMKELQEIFLITVMTWNTKDDIDLHVVDPQGREYYYKKKMHPGSNYELSVDTVVGPGVEIWEAPGATPGQYKVYYNYYQQNDGNQPQIKGRIYYRNKVVVLKDKYISRQGQKIHVATINIDNEGKVTVRR